MALDHAARVLYDWRPLMAGGPQRQPPVVLPRVRNGTTPSLRYWRMRLAVPQQELADLARVARTTITRLEAGGSARLATVRRLAAALEVSPAKLMAQPPEA